MAELSLAEFKAEFPEFDDAGDVLIQSRLDMAHRAYSEAIFGAQHLDAVALKTAHLLASSPFGKSLRLAKGEGPTIYQSQLDDLLRGIPATGVVIV